LRAAIEDINSTLVPGLNHLLFSSLHFFDLFWRAFAACVALLGEPMYPIMTSDLPPQAVLRTSRVCVRRKPNLTGLFSE